jgi:hypothetical protein
MSDKFEEFETKTHDQVAQRCMRCGGYLLKTQRIIRDPQWKGCDSHESCVPQDEYRRYLLWCAKRERRGT